MNFSPTRRQFTGLLATAAMTGALPLRAAEDSSMPDALMQRAKAVVGNKTIRAGRVTVDTPRLADNGHSVPLVVRVESAMTNADFVRRIILVSESNPRPLIATFHLTPQSGRAEITTRIRLNRTQHLMALAEFSDGSFWSNQAEVIVTESACLDAD